MSEREYENLHRFLDGEMTPSERQDFELSLAENSELDEMRKELENMGRLLRNHVESELESVDFSQFYAGIEAQLPGAVAVTGVAAAQRATPVHQGQKAKGGFAEWVSRFWAPTLVGAAAAAAVMFFAVNRSNQSATGGPSPELVVVDSVKVEGSETILVMDPVEKDEATVIWLIDGEQDDQEPIDGEDPI